jgi:hypothetical protein
MTADIRLKVGFAGAAGSATAVPARSGIGEAEKRRMEASKRRGVAFMTK